MRHISGLTKVSKDYRGILKRIFCQMSIIFVPVLLDTADFEIYGDINERNTEKSE